MRPRGWKPSKPARSVDLVGGDEAFVERGIHHGRGHRVDPDLVGAPVRGQGAWSARESRPSPPSTPTTASRRSPACAHMLPMLTMDAARPQFDHALGHGLGDEEDRACSGPRRSRSTQPSYSRNGFGMNKPAALTSSVASACSAASCWRTSSTCGAIAQVGGDPDDVALVAEFSHGLLDPAPCRGRRRPRCRPR